MPVEAGCARNWNSESWPVGVWPPVQVTRDDGAVTGARLLASFTCHGAAGATNESIPNPAGTVITSLLVVSPAFSVGTARL